MRVSSWQRGLQTVAGALALGLLVGLSPSTVKAQAVCGNGVVEGDGGGDCVGDCDGGGSVTVDEIVTMVSAALSGGDGGCPAGDADGSGSITVDEIVTAVNNALNGCPPGGGGGPTGGEECDNGGFCVGGSNAGTACTSEDTCMGDGACLGGPNNLRGCRGDGDCPEGSCRKCRPYGGDTCSANCTDETDRQYTLVPGEVAPDLMSIVDGTSGAVVFGPFLTVPLALQGSQVLTIGNTVNGQAAVIVKVENVVLPAIPVEQIACACVRGAEARTCGGTLFDADGNQSANCTPGFADAEECPTEFACAPVHGPGNTGSGYITCGDPGFDIDYTQDCNGTPGAEPLDPVVTVTDASGTLPAGQGSAFLTLTSAIGTVVGMCSGSAPDYGPDGVFCTDDDPVSNRGAPNSIPFTTSAVQATVLNPGDFEGDILGPFDTNGSPFTCGDPGTAPTVSGANIAGAFTACDQPTVSDIAVPVNFAAE